MNTTLMSQQLFPILASDAAMNIYIEAWMHISPKQQNDLAMREHKCIKHRRIR
jgi:hypothetical protein